MEAPGVPGAFFFSRDATERILSAGVVVVRKTAEGWRVLLLRVYNYWDCPKGLVEPGEDPLAAARREVREETTLDDLEFHWGEDFIETEPYGRENKSRAILRGEDRHRRDFTAGESRARQARTPRVALV